MPNTVQNKMTITGATPEQIQRILKAAEEDSLANEFMPMPNWLNTPNDEGVYPGPVYFERHYNKRMRSPWRHKLQTVGSRFPDGSLDQRWYNWACMHWGTKWGAYECQADEKDGVVTIWFTTAWSPLSHQFFEEMSAAMPDATISCTFEEGGCDFYGVVFAQNGQVAERHGEISDVKYSWAKA